MTPKQYLKKEESEYEEAGENKKPAIAGFFYIRTI